MTNKEKVLERWPNAYAVEYPSQYGISSWAVWSDKGGHGGCLGLGKTEVEAWFCAERSVRLFG